MKRLVVIATLSLLAACGVKRPEEDVLLRRVAQAEEAASRAEAAARKAEDAARRATQGSTVDETIYEPAPEMDAEYGQPSDAEPTG